MKKICDQIRDNGGEPRVEFYMFFFLKFISSVVPTIEYDFTIELELD
jgi:ubiquitin-like-conjugating enzyme ATG3